MAKVAPLSAVEMFNSWARWRSVSPGRALSSESIELYEIYWEAYHRYLAGRQVAIAQAASADVRGFLLDGSHAPTTVARYHRVLHDIYECAVWNGWLRRNPVALLVDDAVATREQPTSTVLFPFERILLQERLEVPGQDGITRRNRLLLSLMLMEGLTVAECLGLEGQNFQKVQGDWQVQLRGARQQQERALTLCPTSAEAWRDLAQQELDPHGHWEAIVFTARAGKPMNRMTAYRAARQFLEDAMADGILKRGALPDAGPAVLRNSAILAWIEEELPFDEVLARAGLQRIDALARLQPFLSPPSQGRLDEAMLEARGPVRLAAPRPDSAW